MTQHGWVFFPVLWCQICRPINHSQSVLEQNTMATACLFILTQRKDFAGRRHICSWFFDKPFITCRRKYGSKLPFNWEVCWEHAVGAFHLVSDRSDVSVTLLTVLHSSLSPLRPRLVTVFQPHLLQVLCNNESEFVLSFLWFLVTRPVGVRSSSYVRGQGGAGFKTDGMFSCDSCSRWKSSSRTNACWNLKQMNQPGCSFSY